MTTYAELVEQIRSYTETDSTVLTQTIVNDVILQAEIRVFREVDLDCFRSYQYTTLTQGNEFVSLPGQTPGTMAFVRTASFYSPTGAQANVRSYLLQKDISYMTEYWPNRTTQGSPKYYAMWDQDTIYLAPTPDSAYNIEGPYDLLAQYEKSYQEAVQRLALEQQGRRRRDEYQDGVIRLPLPSQQP
mgnify:CR=1 FL=1